MTEFSTSSPISTYEQAVWQLAKFELVQKHTPDQLALAVSIVADVFWFSEAKVRHDVQRAIRRVSAEPKPRKRPYGYERRAVI
jgi:hypothetical protein